MRSTTEKQWRDPKWWNKNAGSASYYCPVNAQFYDSKLHPCCIPRPTPWKGPQDGLPPDGTECEISNCGSDFEWCLIKYMGSHLCVVDHKTYHDQHYHLGSVKFRPIQSERDEVTKTALDIFNGSIHALSPREAMEVLYDAGMLIDPERKPMTRVKAINEISAQLAFHSSEPRSVLSGIIADALGYKD